MDDEDPGITALMRADNLLNMTFIIRTVLVAALWILLQVMK